MISLASRSTFNFAASLVSMTVVGITGLIGSLDDFAPFRLGVVGLRNPSDVRSGLGVSLNSLVGLVTTLVFSLTLFDGSLFVGSTVDLMLLSDRPWCTLSAVPSSSVSGIETMSSSLSMIEGSWSWICSMVSISRFPCQFLR